MNQSILKKHRLKNREFVVTAETVTELRKKVIQTHIALSMGITSDTLNVWKDGAEDGEGRESGMKIDDKRDVKQQFVALEWGEVFGLGEEPKYFMKVPLEVTNEDVEINVVDLVSGRLGYVRPETMVERIPKAKVVIE